MRVFFTTDVHGSDVCFRKFLRAASFYRADVLILGGDITGKAMVPLVATNAGHRVRFLGEERTVTDDAEVVALEKQIANTGYYPYRCDVSEHDRLVREPSLSAALLRDLIVRRVEQWVQLAEERLDGNTLCLINAGNDDPPEIDRVLNGSPVIAFGEGRVLELPDGTEVVSCGYANQTPWKCPRDVTEAALADRLEAAIAGVRNCDRALFNFHCPPFDTLIDSGPALGEDMQLRAGVGGVEMRPVGSRACREAIERHQPLLGLHGHLHESRGSFRLGRTLCLNPGSEYTEGVLRGALLDLKKGKVKSHQFTAG